MKLGSIFSGGGLGDFGFMAAGMEIAWQCEIDEYCQKILALRYPDSKKFRDIKILKGSELEPIDILTGGFPCQPFSVAGKQKNKDDNRYLWPEMLRVIKECRPRWIVGENVPGIINLALDTVCADLEAEGYEVWPIVFPSHALGAWHKRDRVWIICHSKYDGQLASQDTRSTQQGSNDSKAREKQASESKRPSEQYAPLADTRCKSEGLSQKGFSIKSKHGNTKEQQAKKRNRLTDFREIMWRRYWLSEPAVGRRINGYPNWLDFHIGKEMSYATQIRYNKKLRELWNPIISQALWKGIGGFNQIQKSEILFAIMCEYEKDANKTWILLESEKALKDFVRGLWLSEKITGSSYRPEHKEQRSQEHSDTLQTLSRLLAHNLQEDWTISSWEDGIPRVSNGVKDRVNRLKVLGNGQVPACTYEIGKIIMEIENGRKF